MIFILIIKQCGNVISPPNSTKQELKKQDRIKKRSDKCPHCDYTSNRNLNIVQHTLNTHATKEERKAKFKYYCEICDYGTFAKSLYDSHTKSQKHVNVTNFIKDKINIKK